jgi:hypothetical protein
MQNINTNTAFIRTTIVGALGRGGSADSGSTMKVMMAYTGTPYNSPDRIGRRDSTLNRVAAI